MLFFYNILSVCGTITGYRDFSKEDFTKLQFVGRARKFNFSIQVRRELLSLCEDKARASKNVKKIAIEKISEIKAKLKELGETKEQPTLGSCVESLVGDHPRVAELLEMHGEPMVRRQTANGKWHGRGVA